MSISFENFQLSIGGDIGNSEGSEKQPNLTWVKKVFHWRWISALLLGITSNILVNAVLDYKYQRSPISFSTDEFLNAIIASFLLLEGMRVITGVLDRRVPWPDGIAKRLGVQFGLHFVYVVTMLNVLLTTITFIFYGGFYSIGDVLVINVAGIILAFFFSIVDTSIYFFKHWKLPSVTGNTLPADLQCTSIQLSLGKVQYRINQESILCAIGQYRMVVVFTSNGQRLLYGQSLESLMKKLDTFRFFQANRQTVLSYKLVQSFKPAAYGKIMVSLVPVNGMTEKIMVSRTRAARFRNWLKHHTR